MLSNKTGQRNVYPMRYLDLQLAFARRVAARVGQPVADVLLAYTSLYKLLGIEGDFDATQPVWQDVLATARGDDAAAGLHRLYRSRLDVIPDFTDEPHWGCFAYTYRPEYNTHTNVIRIHFSNEDDSGLGALSRAHMGARLAELTAMFAHIAAHEPHATTVCGGSWLYNRESYRRLFPPAFTASPVEDEPHYQYRALWGQFLRHDGKVDEEMAASLLQRVASIRGADQIAACFPYQVLLTASPIVAFHAFYAASPQHAADRP